MTSRADPRAERVVKLAKAMLDGLSAFRIDDAVSAVEVLVMAVRIVHHNGPMELKKAIEEYLDFALTQLRKRDA